MSGFKTPITTIKEILPHNNADSLEIAVVYGFNIIVKKGAYKISDPVLYIPVDSILTQKIEDALFDANSKIKLNKHRIRQIRIRGVASQGMLVNIEELQHWVEPEIYEKIVNGYYLEQDLSEVLGITKYEPPAPQVFQSGNIKREKPLENKFFHKYGGISNLKWYPELFKEHEAVVVTEKLHGTSTRMGWVPYHANTFWKKVKQFLRLAPKWEFVYGSNNVQLQQKSGNNCYYGFNVYKHVADKYMMKDRLKPGEVVYGEIIGPDIQKNYTYGTKQNEYKLVLFDLKIQTEEESRYVDSWQFFEFCKERNFEAVPILYQGPFNLEKIKALTLGNSVYEPSQKIREGVVIKPQDETHCSIGRKFLKLISEDYLNDKSNTDFH